MANGLANGRNNHVTAILLRLLFAISTRWLLVSRYISHKREEYFALLSRKRKREFDVFFCKQGILIRLDKISPLQFKKHKLNDWPIVDLGIQNSFSAI